MDEKYVNESVSRCPDCKGELRDYAGHLRCTPCDETFNLSVFYVPIIEQLEARIKKQQEEIELLRRVALAADNAIEWRYDDGSVSAFDRRVQSLLDKWNDFDLHGTGYEALTEAQEGAG